MKNTPRKGLILTVLRPAHGCDCTNGGISSKAKDVLVVGPGIAEVFEESDDIPTVIINDRKGHKFLRPAEQSSKWYMMGGNYATTSDSRWPYGALPIHDRTETAEESARYSA